MYIVLWLHNPSHIRVALIKICVYCTGLSFSHRLSAFGSSNFSLGCPVIGHTITSLKSFYTHRCVKVRTRNHHVNFYHWTHQHGLSNLLSLVQRYGFFHDIEPLELRDFSPIATNDSSTLAELSCHLATTVLYEMAGVYHCHFEGAFCDI